TAWFALLPAAVLVCLLIVSTPHVYEAKHQLRGRTPRACRMPFARRSATPPGASQFRQSAPVPSTTPEHATLRAPPRETSRFQRGKLASMSDVTRILSAIENGDPSAAEQLLPLVYEELRKLAAQRLAQERPGQTLQATALVHEAYLRLVDVDKAQHWNSRGHF